MTIKEYMIKLEEVSKNLIPQGNSKNYSEMMQETVDIWSNESCKGYIIHALENMECDRDFINKVLMQLKYSFEELTIDEAERIYIEW